MDECDASIQTKTADTAHTGIFASVTRPFPDFRVGSGNEASFVVLSVMWKGVAGIGGV